MKKFLSVILAMIFILSVVSVSAFAAESSKAKEWHQNNTLIEDGVKIKCISTHDGETTEAILNIKKQNFSFEMYFENLFENISARATVLYKDGTTYLYITSFPFVHLKFSNIDYDDMLDDVIFPEEVEGEFIRSHEAEGYYIEEYSDEANENFYKYYFIENDLKIIEVTEQENSDNITRIEILEAGISDSVFNLPFFSVDLMPLIDFLTKYTSYAFSSGFLYALSN